MIPTVSRVVHYQSYGTPHGEYLPEARASVITTVKEWEPQGTRSGAGYVGLCILNPTGLFFTQHVPYSAEKRPGTWHWAERA